MLKSGMEQMDNGTTCIVIERKAMFVKLTKVLVLFCFADFHPYRS